MKKQQELENFYQGWIGKSSLVGRTARLLFLKLHSHILCIWRKLQMSLSKIWGGVGLGRDVGRGFERLLGRDGGSHRSTDVTQQERQLSTSGTLRQLGLKFWLHCFLAVSLCASDLTFLGLLFPYLLSGAKKTTAVRIEYIKCFEQCLVQ